MCFPLSVTQRRRQSPASLICCLSLPRTDKRIADTQEQRHAHLSHFAHAHSLSMKKRCSISLPLSGQLAFFRKLARWQTLSVHGFPRRDVLSARSKNTVQGVTRQDSVSPRSLRVDGSLQSFTFSASKSGAKGSPLIGTLQEANNLTEKRRLV